MQNNRFTRRRAVVLGAGLALAAGGVPAQAPWPQRPVKFVVPFAAGGTTTILARLLADRLAQGLGQPVVVDNRPGAGGNVGMDAVAKSEPDGYTLLMGPIGLAINPALYAKMPFDPLKDLVPIGLYAGVPNLLVVHPGVPAQNLAELIAHAKAHPGKLHYASNGNGTSSHLAAEMLKAAAGVDIVHVPYRGAQPAYADLLGDRVDLFFDLTPTTRAHVDTGKLKAIAVSSAERNPMQPTVQTINESGTVKLELESWFGYFAPSKTPPEVLARLRTELAKIIATPELQETFRKAGGSPMKISVADTKTMLARDVQRWTGLIRAANISLD